MLDPFEVGAKNLDILEQQLRALNRPRLLNIIAAYELNPGGQDCRGCRPPSSVRFIVLAVDVQLAHRASDHRAARNNSSAELRTVQRSRWGYCSSRARKSCTIAATSRERWPLSTALVHRVGKKMSPVR